MHKGLAKLMKKGQWSHKQGLQAREATIESHKETQMEMGKHALLDCCETEEATDSENEDDIDEEETANEDTGEATSEQNTTSQDHCARTGEQLQMKD